jgi:hypothetical protein
VNALPAPRPLFDFARLRLAARFACSFASALRGFLRGFVGATRLAHDSHGVRDALALRAEQRRGCC